MMLSKLCSIAVIVWPQVVLLVCFIKLDVFANSSSSLIADTQPKLAYGSMLNISCVTSEDCLLKHSLCNPLTKRCECDYGTIEDNSRCEVIKCSASEECLNRFPNTVCMFGRCQCRYGLKANGQCVKVEVETIKQMPDWAISVIAIGALLSGVLGGRSQVVAQLIHHIMAIVALLTGQMTRFSSRPSTDDSSPSAGEAVTEVDNLQMQTNVRQSIAESSRFSLSSQSASPVLSAPSAQLTQSSQSEPSRVSIESVRFN